MFKMRKQAFEHHLFMSIHGQVTGFDHGLGIQTDKTELYMIRFGKHLHEKTLCPSITFAKGVQRIDIAIERDECRNFFIIG